MKNELTNEEKDMLHEILQAYCDKMRAKKDECDTLLNYAQISGAVQAHGDLYIQNKNVWDIREKSKNWIDERTLKATQLISKITFS